MLSYKIETKLEDKIRNDLNKASLYIKQEKIKDAENILLLIEEILEVNSLIFSLKQIKENQLTNI